MRAAAEEVRARYVARHAEYPADWQAASGEVFSVAHVTAEELDRMRAQVLEVMAPYVRLDAASQAGALPVRITLDLFPWFGPEQARARRGHAGGGHAGGGPVKASWRSGPLARAELPAAGRRPVRVDDR